MTHGKKVPLEKFLNSYFGLKHPKMTTLEWDKVSGLVLKSVCSCSSPKFPFFPRIVLLLSRIVLFYPEVPFCFLELPFCF